MTTASDHASHCCYIHGCNYGDEDCPVVYGRVAAVSIAPGACKYCDFDGLSSRRIPSAHLILRNTRIVRVQWQNFDILKPTIDFVYTNPGTQPVGVLESFLLEDVLVFDLSTMKIADALWVALKKRIPGFKMPSAKDLWLFIQRVRVEVAEILAEKVARTWKDIPVSVMTEAWDAETIRKVMES